MKTKYKLLALVPLMALVGCGKKYEHKNIFLDMAKDGTKRTILIRDVETGTERIFNSDEYSAGRHIHTWYKNYDYLQPGDTVTIVVGGIYSDKAYQNYKVLSSSELSLTYNKDSIDNRMEREKYAQEYQKFCTMKQNRQDTKQK